MIYVLTVANAVILGLVLYLFFSFRQALDSSGLKQIDDYLHELEGSVAQLTEEFERTSSRISRDLLRKTTELQTLIGECDTKLAHLGRVSASPQPAVGSEPSLKPAMGVPTVPAAVAARRLSAVEQMSAEALKKKGEGREETEKGPPSPQPVAAQPVPASSTIEAFVENVAGPSKRAISTDSPSSARTEGSVGRPVSPSSSGTSAAQPNEKYRLIFLLASEGMDSASIARHTNLTRGEVEMLLDLRRQGKI